jgi:GDP-L-fucose synthase
MEPGARVYVAGSTTLLGGALRRHLLATGYRVLPESGDEPDLCDAAAVEAFFATHAPAYVFLAAGRSGGIRANLTHPADLMRDNLLVACNVMEAARGHAAHKLLYLASSCAYPRECVQPMPVTALQQGPVEPTSEAYATAKLAGIVLARAYRQQYGAGFISAVPAAAFGPGDLFDPDEAHVIGALIHRLHEAKRSRTPHVAIWGDGTARREFIYVDDLARACAAVMDRYDEPVPINLGSSTDVTIRELASLIREVVEYPGELVFEAQQPSGTPVKLLDSTPLRDLGWRPTTGLRAGLVATYAWFLKHVAQR